MLNIGDFDYVRRLVHDTAGILIDGDKSYLAEARLDPLVRRLGLESIGELVEFLESGTAPDLGRQTVEAMVNGETLFFRDIAMFEMLRMTVLPRLIAARAEQRRLHVWSAACSTGQEPYSLAMLLVDHFPELATWDVQLIATDLSTESLERARDGGYSQFEINRGLPASMLIRHFTQHGDRWDVTGRAREMVQFRQLNLLRDPPPITPVDLVLLRNVMIYWDLDTKRAALGRMRHAFSRDTILVLGAAESAFQIEDLIEREGFTGASCFHPVG